MNGGAWWAIVIVHGVAESDTTERLHFHIHFMGPSLGRYPMFSFCLLFIENI